MLGDSPDWDFATQTAHAGTFHRSPICPKTYSRRWLR